MLAAACGDDNEPASDAAVVVSDARLADASVDGGSPDAGPSPPDISWEHLVPNINSETAGLEVIEGDLLLIGTDLVRFDLAGEERSRRHLEEETVNSGQVLGGELVMMRQEALYSTIERFGSELETLSSTQSPNAPRTVESWAPTVDSIWLLGYGAVNQVGRNGLAEVPREGAARQWDVVWDKSITPYSGLATAAGVPLFAGLCVTEPSIVETCMLRVDPLTDELSSVALDSNHSLLGAWMVEIPEGVLVLFWRGDGTGHSSFHGALVDPDDLSVLTGPAQLFDNVNGENIKGLTVLGDYAYVSSSEYVFRFHVPTMSGWTRYPLAFPAGEGLEVTDNSSNHGVAVLDGELYHYVGVYLGFGSGVLVQRLVPPPP